MKKMILGFVILMVACGDETKVISNGGACPAENEVCESDLCLEQFEDDVAVTGGICTQECVWNEDYTDNCPEGEICLQYRWTGEKYCFLDCDSQSDCREGLICQEVGNAEAACVPPL